MKLIIAGGAGYIGGILARFLAEHGHAVTIWDDLSTGHRAAVGKLPFVRLDIGDEEAVRAALGRARPDVVMHLCARSLVGESVERPFEYWRNNVQAGITLVRALCERGEPVRLVFSGTAASYGVQRASPLTEDLPARPINPYGHTKVAFEWFLEDIAGSGAGLSFVALRYFNAAGAWPDGSLGECHRPETHLIPLVLHTALGLRERVDILGADYESPDGTCVRDYVHVLDLADAHLCAARYLVEGGASAVLNLGNSRGASVREVIRCAERVTGKAIPSREAPRRPGDPAVLVASAARAREVLGWRPRHEALDTIIEHAWRWHRAHPDGYGPCPT